MKESFQKALFLFNLGYSMHPRDSAPSDTRSRPRPLSPHLSIYRRTMTMSMSVLHRLTALASCGSLFLLALLFVSLAEGGGLHENFMKICLSPFGLWVSFFLTWAFMHHLCGGIRHLIWDAGYGLDHPAREYLAWVTFFGGILLTLLVGWQIYPVIPLR